MKRGRQLAVFVASLVLGLGVGCEKKKPQLPVQAHAPTLSVPMPEQIEEAEVPVPEPEPKTEAVVVPEPPKPKPPKHRSSSRKPPQTVGNAQNGGTVPPAATATVATARPPAGEPPPDMAIAADVSSEQLSHQKQNTTQLLDNTEKNVKALNRSLSHDEEATLNQIKTYVSQSRKATSDGDFERAYNLAMKAYLLSDALVKK